RSLPLQRSSRREPFPGTRPTHAACSAPTMPGQIHATPRYALWQAAPVGLPRCAEGAVRAVGQAQPLAGALGRARPVPAQNGVYFFYSLSASLQLLTPGFLQAILKETQ